MANGGKKLIMLCTLICVAIPLVFGGVKLVIVGCNRFIRVEDAAAKNREALEQKADREKVNMRIAEMDKTVKDLKTSVDALSKNVIELSNQTAILNTRLEYIVPPPSGGKQKTQ